VYYCRQILTFRRNILQPSSGFESALLHIKLQGRSHP
jgi:hypothetical protein